ncbi:Peroxin-3-domain-containing protein [Neohortaea acidophila]|uniref:25S rRNA adenine-N(1) methyltransferase n=1 Tax=Neohortaea acidophila TaxID=245834 RepID=A0A6A6PY08_9PEZI|nr:Peroxin-3-domain-containing protein [Neohortaea acidophila]KAF2484624.1 Peroxin-3-domain-containing protein [Neohortaea acidophila]
MTPGKSSHKKRKTLHHGRPPTAKKTTASLSKKATQKLIRSQHQLSKKLATAQETGDAAAIKDVENQINDLGGLQSYQLASIQGQSSERGGDSSKVLMDWLHDVQPELASAEPKLRMLEIGALSTRNACSRSGLFDIQRIDLHSQEKGIVQQDFMQRPLPGNASERFDMISLSLVLNFVPTPEGRGEMLRRTCQFLDREAAKDMPDPVREVFPALFLVLPAACIANSRYMTGERFGELMDSLGFRMLKSKQTAKLIYQLCITPSSIPITTTLDGAMIEATRRWFRRNRTSLLIGAGVIGAGYVATQYVLNKIQEARQRMTEDRVSRENLRRRFEQNQEDCTYTVLALLPTVREEIIGALPVEQITEQLQQERQERLKKLSASEAPSSEYPSAPPSVITDDAASLQSGSYIHASQITSNPTELGAPPLRPRRSKAQLWQEMKLNSIARALTLIYTVCLLTMLTRIQLNLLGRRTYLSSVVALATPPAPMEDSRISLENRDDDNYDNMYGNDFETNRKYLTFSWWLLHRGSKQIMDRVLTVVKSVFGTVNIREDISLERLADLIMQVRTQIEGITEEERRQMKWLTYLLPPREDEAFVIRQSSMSEGEDDSPSPAAHSVEDPMTASAVEAETAVNDSLRRLLDETSDLIDSPTFTHVLTRILDASFSHLVDYRIATEAFKATGLAAPGTAAADEPRITEVVDTKSKIAHILPIFCRQAHVIATGSGELDAISGVVAPQDAPLGNEYLAAIDGVHDLNAFAAVIYSSNFEYEFGSGGNTTVPLPSRPSAPLDAQALGENTLEDAGVLLPAAEEEAPAAGGGGFESAWKRALDDGAGGDR